MRGAARAAQHGLVTRLSSLSPAAGALLLFVVVLGCAGFLLAIPRGVAWTEAPSLVLPPDAVRAALAADRELAERAPETAAAQNLDRLWLELGRANRGGYEPMPERLARRRAMGLAYTRVVKESGEAAALALRSAAAERLEAALDVQLAPELARDVLGDFALMLEGEGCARDGELIAPRFVARTLYKARWSLAFGLAPDHGFARAEKLAYYGWQSLHATRLPLEQRLRALAAYARAGGTHTNEAAGVLLHQSGQAEAAARAFSAAYDNRKTLRLRNALLGQMDVASMALTP